MDGGFSTSGDYLDGGKRRKMCIPLSLILTTIPGSIIRAIRAPSFVNNKNVEKPRFLFSKVSSSKVSPRWRTGVVTVSVSTPRPARHKTRPRSPETIGAKLVTSPDWRNVWQWE